MVPEDSTKNHQRGILHTMHGSISIQPSNVRHCDHSIQFDEKQCGVEYCMSLVDCEEY